MFEELIRSFGKLYAARAELSGLLIGLVATLSRGPIDNALDRRRMRRKHADACRELLALVDMPTLQEDIMIQMPVDAEIRKAACLIAVKCRRVIQSVLRDEEISEADREFSEIAEAIIRELSAYKGSR